MMDFTDEEIKSVQHLVDSRYKESIELHLADCEVQLDVISANIVEKPALFWHARQCNFVMIKLHSDCFRGQFFYNPDEQFDNDQLEYSDAVNCAAALLQSQADHERESQGVLSGSTGSDLN